MIMAESLPWRNEKSYLYETVYISFSLTALLNYRNVQASDISFLSHNKTKGMKDKTKSHKTQNIDHESDNNIYAKYTLLQFFPHPQSRYK